MRKRPRDVKSWRAFWSLPEDAGPYLERPAAELEKTQEAWDALAEWDAYWTEWHEWRCAVLMKVHGLGIHFDRDEADRHVRFFRALPLTQARWAGKRFEPMAWQEHQVIIPVFGYLRGDGSRLFRDVFVFVAKKQGKGDLAAGFVLDQLFVEDEPGCEVYGAARNSKQAGIVFNRAYSMVKASPPLARRCHPVDSVKRIVVPNPSGADAFYQVLSSNVGALEGPSMQALVVDEVHVVPHALLDVITDGSGAARTQPLRFYTTTAGDDFNMPWYDLLQFAMGVEDGVITNAPGFLPVLYMLRPDEGDDWTDERLWHKANPSLGVTTTIEEMRDEFAKAISIPVKQASFKRRRLNIPVADGAGRYLPMEAWDACDVTGTIAELARVRTRMLAELEGRQAVGWLDLSSRTDITTFGLLFEGPDGLVIPLPWFFLPEENLEARGERDRAHYRAWADHGFVELTPGNATDQRIVRERIVELRERYRFTEIAYDDWNAGKIEIELAEEDGFTMIPVAQGIKTMSTPTKELLALTLSGKIKHGGNPVLRYMADNLSVTGDRNERVQPNKSKSTGRIDGVVGIIMALDRVIRRQDDAPTPEPYKDRDVLFF